MASSVFFRFKSQKEPTRVTFDGTGISVFELKREIILLSRLGDGTDFELTLTSNDGSDVYDDDTTIIPRSTTVIARRLPAARPGKGGAARYVSGKMPVNAKNSHRQENMKAGAKSQPTKPTGIVPTVSELQTEEERMAAVLQMGADQWDQQKQQMATATPVIRPGAKGKPVTVPDHPPPAGYVCYRCGEKGHWIQVCPTNDDPTFENRPRIKRTTGIPKSFLKSVEKPTKLDDGSSDDNKVPAGVMVNADGDWVIAEPDKASWEQYQAKASKSVAAQKEAALDSKEIHDRGLECPIDKRMFVEPSRTPCCQTTYCNECITNALLDGDLQCPNCGKEGILIDDLKPDDEMIKKIRSYEEEKAAEAKKKEVDEVSSEKDRTEDKKESVDETTREDARSNKSSSPEKSPSSSNSKLAPDSKKRKADTDLENDRKSPGVTVTLNQKEADKETTKDDEKPKTAAKPAQAAPKFPPELEFMNQAGMANGALMPNMAGFPNMPMNMPMNMGMPMGMDMNMNMNMMGMDPAMWNQMMMMQSGMSNQWNGMNGMNGMPVGMNGMPMQPTNGYYGGNQHMNMAGYGQPNGQMMHGNGNGYGRGRGGQFNNNFTHQQRHHNFSAPQPNNQESAYFRQPVNPHRHQSRRNVPRPTDYREI